MLKQGAIFVLMCNYCLLYIAFCLIINSAWHRLLGIKEPVQKATILHEFYYVVEIKIKLCPPHGISIFLCWYLFITKLSEVEREPVQNNTMLHQFYYMVELKMNLCPPHSISVFLCWYLFTTKLSEVKSEIFLNEGMRNFL